MEKDEVWMHFFVFWWRDRLDAVTSSPQFEHFLTDDLRRPSVALRNAVCLLAGENTIIIELATLLLCGRLTMEKDEVWMDENRKRSRKRVAVARRGDDEARANCLAVTVQQSRGAVLTRRVPIACILTVTTRGGGGGTAMTCVVIRAARF
ncbi:hypothetical protein J6590_097128 [Homalodisca vitripennis]|nr:hypothetical protein J6590_097128 [Homalodisca vitripennis]